MDDTAASLVNPRTSNSPGISTLMMRTAYSSPNTVGINNRVGIAVQLGTVRLLGTFLEDPTEMPMAVVCFAADHLLIADVAERMTLYGASEGRRRHGGRIRERYGYRVFADFGMVFRLNRVLYALS